MNTDTTFQKLKTAGNKLVDGAEQTITNIGDNVSNYVNDVESKANEALSQMQDNIEDVTNSVTTSAKSFVKDIQQRFEPSSDEKKNTTASNSVTKNYAGEGEEDDAVEEEDAVEEDDAVEEEDAVEEDDAVEEEDEVEDKDQEIIDANDELVATDDESQEDLNSDDDDDISDEDMEDSTNEPVSKVIETTLGINDVSSDEDSDSEDDNYLQKFSDAVKTDYLVEFHPEAQAHNYEEVKKFSTVKRNKRGEIIDPFHRTIPILTKFEKARILGQRAKQLNSGAESTVKVQEGTMDGYLIAIQELQEKNTFIIRRPIPNGGFEYWKLSDLEILE